MKAINIFISIAISTGYVVSAYAAPPAGKTFTVSNECTTPQTGLNGIRKSCDAEVCFRADKIKFSSVKVRATHERGSENRCGAPYIAETVDNGWDVVVKKVCSSIHARSNSGAFSGHAKTACELTGLYMDL
jgi:hypothetical protein